MTSCPGCNAPLAADQRYCLQCGTRGGEARLPFLDVLRTDAGQSAGVPAPAVLPVARLTAQQRLEANSGLIAGVGVLLLAMLIGVLIGSGLGGGDSPQAAAAPQVISVGGGGVAAPIGATGTSGADVGAADVSTRSTKKKAKKQSSSASTSSPAADSKAPVKATNNAVKQLDKLTGKAAQKAADKLGKKIATGGKAPKKDSKPAAAGGSFDTIG